MAQDGRKSEIGRQDDQDTHEKNEGVEEEAVGGNGSGVVVCMSEDAN